MLRALEEALPGEPELGTKNAYLKLTDNEQVLVTSSVSYATFILRASFLRKLTYSIFQLNTSKLAPSSIFVITKDTKLFR